MNSNEFLFKPKNTFKGNFRRFSVLICEFNILINQADLIERRSRRDMSPQGRKRVAGMVSRDYQTVSGIGGGSHNYQQVRDV